MQTHSHACISCSFMLHICALRDYLRLVEESRVRRRRCKMIEQKRNIHNKNRKLALRERTKKEIINCNTNRFNRVKNSNLLFIDFPVRSIRVKSMALTFNRSTIDAMGIGRRHLRSYRCLSILSARRASEWFAIHIFLVRLNCIWLVATRAPTDQRFVATIYK